MGKQMGQVLRHAFTAEIDELVQRYVASVDDDRHLLAADVRGSLAHVAMLEKTGIVTPEQATRIRGGLEQIRAEGLELKVEDEDVHMAVERRLEALVGEDARLLHSARSRNDQVATDLRIFVDEKAAEIREALRSLQGALVEKAGANPRAVMPGYTHLQRAQAVLFAHVLLSFREAFARDERRFEIPFVSPLGAGALAGTSLPVDPAYTAEQLGASAVFRNSIDAVSDRDFAAEFLFASALAAVHMSQLAENFILWCTAEFGFVSLPDELTTGSSIMPQKKNPDCLELVRGRAGQAVGELVNMLVTLKGLSFGYNRDLQETKPPVIRVAQTLLDGIRVCELAVRKLVVHEEAMLEAASDEFLFATDIVEHLVRQGVPFRDAHTRVARLVRNGRRFSSLTPEEWREVEIDPEAAGLVDAAASAAAKTSPGGAGNASVATQLERARAGN
jgi:argininosuccinate lyase